MLVSTLCEGLTRADERIVDRYGEDPRVELKTTKPVPLPLLGSAPPAFFLREDGCIADDSQRDPMLNAGALGFIDESLKYPSI